MDNPPSVGPPRGALEDLVYRDRPDEGALRRASPWLTVPATLAVAAALVGAAFTLGGGAAAGRQAPASVGVVLQEGPGPVRAAPAPARPAPAPAPRAAAAGPAPREAAPAPPVPETAPDAPPRELPLEDLSRQAGGLGGTGAGPGGAGGSGTGPVGAGAAGAGGAAVLELESTQVRVLHQPPLPPYPRLAQMARIQGTVVVQITMGPDGVPTSARAVEGPFQLRAAAEAYALTWRFSPAVVDGVPRASRFKLNITFYLT